MSASTINLIDNTKRLSVAASRSAAIRRRAAAAAGLLRIDGKVVIVADKARDLLIPANLLRKAVSLGINTTPDLLAMRASKMHPDDWARSPKRRALNP